MTKKFGLPCAAVILIFSFISISNFVLADEPHSALDNSPSVDASAKQAPAAATALPQEPTTTSDADETVDENAPAATQTYVYDLKKLIIKSRENIKRVNEKIKEQAVIKRNQKREERAREYYQRGMQLNDEGKFDEAREYFEKAVRLTEHPEMNKYIQQSEFKLKAQEAAIKREQSQQIHQMEADKQSKLQDAQQGYEEAVRFYREKKFQEAKDQFEHVEELSPDYKATRSYLRIIDQDIIAAETVAQKQQKVEMEHQNKEAEAARQKEKEEWKKEIDKKEVERKDQVNKQAENVYDEAVNLYKEKKFGEAKKRFEEVEWVIPDYKATRNYLNRMDKDIAEEEKRVEAEKAKALAKQQWEDAVAARKREADEKKAAEIREKEHLKQVDEEAGFIYQAAITLFDKGLLDDALEKFNDVEKVMSGYKSSKIYMAKIAKIKDDQKRKIEEAAAQEQKQKILAEDKAKRDAELERLRLQEAEIKQRQRQLELDTEAVYSVGVELYNQHHYVEAKEKFTQTAAQIPNYKKVQDYLHRIDEDIIHQQEQLQLQAKKQQIMADTQERIAAAREGRRAREIPPVPVPPLPVSTLQPAVAVASTPAAAVPTPVAVPLPTPTPVFSASAKEEEIQEAQEIYELAQKSSQLYKQIALLANDKRITPAKKKMAQVDQVLNNLKTQKENLLRQIHLEEEKQREQEIKRQQEEARAKTEQMYDEAIVLLRNHQFDEAKARFSEINRSSPNYKATDQYLSRLEKDRKQAEADAILERTRNEQKHLKELHDQQVAQEKARRAAEEERQRQLQQAQEAEVQSLADKAAILNDDILLLSQRKDFKGAKAKFAELEQVLDALQTVKQSMMKAEEREDLARREAQQNAKVMVMPSQGITQSAAGMNPDMLRKREALRENQQLFRQGVDLYQQKRYEAARLIFESLAEQGDGSARSYLAKIDRMADNDIKHAKAQEQKERDDYLDERRKQQHLRELMQEKEMMRQREFTQAMEREKSVADEERMRQRRHQEILKIQAKERLNRERERLQAEEEFKQQHKTFGFRKLAPVKKEEAEAEAVAEPVPTFKNVAQAEAEPEPEAAPVPEEPEHVEPPAPPAPPVVEITPQQRKAQMEISKRRKRALEEKYKKEQQQKAIERQRQMEEQRLAQEEKQEKEQRLKEKETVAKKQHKDKIEKMAKDAAKAEPEEENQKVEITTQQRKAQLEISNKRKKALDEKYKKEQKQKELERQKQVEDERRAQEEKRRTEIKLKQQEAKAERERKIQMEKDARERQKTLEEERQQAKRHLVEGAESLYKEAMQLYKDQNYPAAVSKFQDIEDIVPDYKQTRLYIQKAKTAPTPAPAPVYQPPAPTTEITVPVVTTTQPASTTYSREKSIQKTLDLFDPNAH